jgi:hypothetical protein
LNGADHSHFVAIREFEALDTFSPYLMGERISVDDSKPELSEKLRLVSESKDPSQTKSRRVGESRFHNHPAKTPSLILVVNGNGLEFGEIIPDHMERRRSDNAPLRIRDDIKVTYGLIDLIEIPVEHVFALSKGGDKLLESRCIMDGCPSGYKSRGCGDGQGSGMSSWGELLGIFLMVQKGS